MPPGPDRPDGAGASQLGTSADPTVGTLRAALDDTTLRDRQRLSRRLRRAGAVQDPRRRADQLRRLADDVAAAQTRLARRAASVPSLTYPPELPISAARDELLATLREHRVVVVAGETGSGKTTQLPKLALELGRGVRGAIGHTQPRRIAARSVAARIAEELDVELGAQVGYQVRFGDRTSADTLVKVMTDGILLAEVHDDPHLLAYDTLIVDEAHERSLTIDFLLGYLVRLLPRRRDLQLVITSATIDPGRFADYVADATGEAVPVVEVSGRTYPVEVRYRPYGPGHDPPDAERDQVQAVVDAVAEHVDDGPGDVLVFLAGEREIRDTADALAAYPWGTSYRTPEILPLYSRLTPAEQHRVFAPHPGRRVVLATNVAETSLTVPGIRGVVDAGTARISRYSQRLKVQRLPIEPVSQASARQRAGRCGRTSDGVCIRLYSEEDYAARPPFTDPEILRTNLAAVLLRMAVLDLGDVESFGFLDPPDARGVRDGLALLHELGAMAPPGTGAEHATTPRLTPLGRRLARLPLDPRLGRMVLEGVTAGTLADVLVITAGLTVQDPRERPLEHREAADRLHARFQVPGSDLLSLLALWEHVGEQQRERTSSGFRRMCRDEYLNFLRVREWQDLVGQLWQVVRELDAPAGGGPSDEVRGDERRRADRSIQGWRDRADLIHRSLLPGLLTHVGAWDQERRDYTGVRNARFALWPGSSLTKTPPRWVMAGELVETSRLWGRDVAAIDPRWVEAAAAHLLRRRHAEPRWDARRGQAVASETVTMLGLTLVAGRTVNLARVDPALARELFIRHALVEGDWDTRHAFLAENRRLLDEAAQAEERLRRRDVVVDDEELVAFYDARIPADIVSARHFDRWWKEARRRDPGLLTFDPAMLRRDTTAGHAADPEDFPDQWDGDLPLEYRFQPGHPHDGVTVTVPLTVLPGLAAAPFTWQVPGLREDLAVALVRSLPKGIRRSFVPAPDVTAAALQRVRGGPADGEPFPAALAVALSSFGGTRVSVSDFAVEQVPAHLRMTFRVVDAEGRQVAAGKDLAALQQQLAPAAGSALAAIAPGLERRGLRTWPDHLPDGRLPSVVTGRRGSHDVTGHPALVADSDEAVAVRVLPTVVAQRRAMPLGVRQLLLLDVGVPVSAVQARLAVPTKLVLAGWASGHGVTTAELVADAAAAVVDQLVVEQGVPWDVAAYAALRGRVRDALPARTQAAVLSAGRVLAAAQELTALLEGPLPSSAGPAVDDVREQVADLTGPGFLARAGLARLPALQRYLAAARVRVEALRRDVVRDFQRMEQVHAAEQAVTDAVAALPPERHLDADVAGLRWQVQELRVSLFAQNLGTAHPVSVQRIRKAAAAVAAPAGE
jgi:ATP-dependent helicase HrpA